MRDIIALLGTVDAWCYTFNGNRRWVILYL